MTHNPYSMCFWSSMVKNCFGSTKGCLFDSHETKNVYFVMHCYWLWIKRLPNEQNVNDWQLLLFSDRDQHHLKITDQNNKPMQEFSMIYSLHNPAIQLLLSNVTPTPSHDLLGAMCTILCLQSMNTCWQATSRVLLGKQQSSYQITVYCTPIITFEHTKLFIYWCSDETV